MPQLDHDSGAPYLNRHAKDSVGELWTRAAHPKRQQRVHVRFYLALRVHPLLGLALHLGVFFLVLVFQNPAFLVIFPRGLLAVDEPVIREPRLDVAEVGNCFDDLIELQGGRNGFDLVDLRDLGVPVLLCRLLLLPVVAGIENIVLLFKLVVFHLNEEMWRVILHKTVKKGDELLLLNNLQLHLMCIIPKKFARPSLRRSCCCNVARPYVCAIV